MPHRFVAYIDESGDEGFVFHDDRPEDGSSKWFVISAVVTPADRDRDVISLGRDIRSVLNIQKPSSISRT
jgi:hypothetical protein